MKILSKNLKYRGKVLNVAEVEVQVNGRKLRRELFEQEDGVAVVPIDKDGNVFLIREFFIGAGRQILQLPGGKTSAKTDSEIRQEAQRELREETGLAAGRLIKLHYSWAHPWFSSRKIHIFLGLDLKAAPLKSTDAEEVIQVVKMRLDKAIKKVSSDFVSDFAAIGYLLLAREKLREMGVINNEKQSG